MRSHESSEMQGAGHPGGHSHRHYHQRHHGYHSHPPTPSPPHSHPAPANLPPTSHSAPPLPASRPHSSGQVPSTHAPHPHHYQHHQQRRSGYEPPAWASPSLPGERRRDAGALALPPAPSMASTAALPAPYSPRQHPGTAPAPTAGTGPPCPPYPLLSHRERILALRLFETQIQNDVSFALFRGEADKSTQAARENLLLRARTRDPTLFPVLEKALLQGKKPPLPLLVAKRAGWEGGEAEASTVAAEAQEVLVWHLQNKALQVLVEVWKEGQREGGREGGKEQGATRREREGEEEV
ncbi:hypothetical protein NSK_005485 [Nannochloropsis salina CCMP1776]|uniref:Uncharacterized protein n=1 Tax=Nannochloropsis salina CCMP1776 TaxID=1027361 RepID=A0A4D9CZY7_9STRA|nr:hypothetical protein NSK_005485 [Nannochloropsis salina CCMP1776]|eukprot:TFJ83213.1 hypothetical protein NSK_005485 [Nannochloropsis salina CCMP1776]